MRNRDALSTTSNKHSLPASGVLGILCRSTSKTSHGSRYLADSIAMRWLRDHFLRRHPLDKIYSLESLHIPGQWKRSRSSENVLSTPGCPCSTPGCPCWQCTKESKSATKPRGTARTDMRLARIPRRSNSYHTRPWSSRRYLATSFSPNLPLPVVPPSPPIASLTLPRSESFFCSRTRPGTSRNASMSLSTTARSGGRSLGGNPSPFVGELLAPPGVGVVVARPVDPPVDDGGVSPPPPPLS